MARPAGRLQRLLRVRTLQLDQMRAQEADARRRVDDAQSLRQRIDELAAGVEPVVAAANAATLFHAAAQYRARLHESAEAAARRASTAAEGLAAARAATQAAHRDQSAIEKLIERARNEAMRRERRALEDMPATPRKRHDPC
ncbi:hypothetical protein ACX40Y_03085 [Sphingomonas sp. RS6]